jgi:hypothetical protein
MREHSNASLSWGKVVLAVLPGVFALGTEIGLWRRLFHISIEPAWRFDLPALLFLCVLLCLIGFVHERRFPTWSFPALGIVLAHMSMGATISLLLLILWIGIVAVTIGEWRWHQAPVMQWEAWLLGLILVGCVLYPLTVRYNSGPPTAYQRVLSTLTTPVAVLTTLSVLPAIIGLLLARRASVLAGLVFVGSAFVMWESIGDPEYALLMWTDNKTIEMVVSIHPQLFFLISVPILVVRLRSAKARIVGFLLPICTAFISAAVIGSAVRPYSSFVHSIVFDLLLILLPLAIVVVIYAKASRALHTQAGFTEA